jgi:Tol biopolymer transport system component
VRRTLPVGRVLVAGGLLGLFGLLACAGSVAKEQLESAPLAIVYRTFGERELLLDRVSSRDAEYNAAKSRSGAMDLNAAQTTLGLLTQQDIDKALVGRLMVLDPIGEGPKDPGFPTRGARPLDWSPGHERLLYLAKGRTGPQVFEWNRKTGDVLRLSYEGDRYLGGAYGPDGAIAFSRVEPLRVTSAGTIVGGAQIYVRTRDGGKEVPVSPGPIDMEPAWSPAGGPVVYEARDEHGTQHIRSADPDGSGASRILARGRSPSYSPDGQWVVYSAPVRGRWALWLMRPDGTGRRPFGSGPFEEGTPTFSPDGRLVLYVGTPKSTEHDTQLMIRPLDGKADHAVQLDGDGLHPVW